MAVASFTSKGVRWLHIHRPTKKDIAFIGNQFPFHPLDLDDCLSRVQRPKLDVYNDYVFFVLHFAQIKKAKRRVRKRGRVRLPPGDNRLSEIEIVVIDELNAFVGKDFLVTVDKGELDHVNRLFREAGESPRQAETMLAHGPVYLFYLLIEQLIDDSFTVMNKLGEKIDRLDQEIFSTQSIHVVEDINVVRRNVIVMQTMLKPEINIFTRLETAGREINPVLDDFMIGYWGNTSDHLKKLKDGLEDYREIIDGLSQTYESLVSNRTNEIIKILTIFSVILMPLSLIAGIYGMNITLPLGQELHTFSLVVWIMVAIASVMAAYFKWKRWF
jgi:magnesium transporter